MDVSRQVHRLNASADFMAFLRSGEQTFDVRENTRGFTEGDLIAYIGYPPNAMSFCKPEPTGEEIVREIGVVWRTRLDGATPGATPLPGLERGWCAFTLKVPEGDGHQAVLRCAEVSPGTEAFVGGPCYCIYRYGHEGAHSFDVPMEASP